MRIGEAAKRVDLPESTIRYYEKRGLLPPLNRVSGKRVFDSNAIATLQFIKLGQAAGFTITEIQNLLRRFSAANTDDTQWQPEVVSKQLEIREKIKELEQADAVLTKLKDCRCKSIEQCISPTRK